VSNDPASAATIPEVVITGDAGARQLVKNYDAHSSSRIARTKVRRPLLRAGRPR
jgi:hypothetical protein